MTDAFKRVSRLSVGYEPQAVDEFLARAKKAYESPDASRLGFTSAEVHSAAFPTARGGYDLGRVDEALDRLADAFALQERDREIARRGEEAWIRELTARAEVLQERLERPRGLRFRPCEGRQNGYSKGDVDDLCDQLVAYFSEGEPMSVDDVRRSAFRVAGGRHAYSEAVVDVYLDRVADVMASVP